jgi:hypothetical protein
VRATFGSNKRIFISEEVQLYLDMRLRKVAVSAFLLGLGADIWFPTADEIVIHPTLGLFLSYILPY